MIFLVKHSSMIMPRKIVFLTCFMFSSLMLSFIYKYLLHSCLGLLFEDLNKMNLVFLIFKDNLLTFSHSETLLISVCIILLRVLKQLLLHEIVMSSANNINDSNLLLCHLYIAERELVLELILVRHLF